MAEELKQPTPREFLTEFIELYRSHTCLWLVKSKDYSDRNKRDIAYAELVKKFQEFDSSADRNIVIKKISALRTVYKRELSKVVKSEKSGTGQDDVYKPSLWYFDLLHFLRDQESARPSRSTMSDGNPETEQYEDSEHMHLPHSQEGEVALPMSGDDRCSTSPSPNAKSKKKKMLSSADEVIELAGERLKNIHPDDEFEAYGKYVAHKLRSLKRTQAIFARKLINDVIFEGELETLSKDYKVMNSQPYNPQLYHQQPYPLPYISGMPDHPWPFSSSNNILQHPNSATLPYPQTFNRDTPDVSNMALPNDPTNSATLPYPQTFNRDTPDVSNMALPNDPTNSPTLPYPQTFNRDTPDVSNMALPNDPTNSPKQP
ncbi:uncharacterized protein LOC126883079 [Diabrotica virgifera virgifera]|uniref:MADF domain-containing protein n=1 Tax=Diabrotica virgifera virgifera TaxID=50390 RepID=A0ABM5K247_DIAVI|nr:uncharacterized protein LOC126880091 [Diabrotica virgifera virgifera]XP_050504265.1 uncharacterized protein LOC126883079 [Diabrotica virgifera virgifera]